MWVVLNRIQEMIYDIYQLPCDGLDPGNEPYYVNLNVEGRIVTFNLYDSFVHVIMGSSCRDVVYYGDPNLLLKLKFYLGPPIK